jgi:hypothetical protein
MLAAARANRSQTRFRRYQLPRGCPRPRLYHQKTGRYRSRPRRRSYLPRMNRLRPTGARRRGHASNVAKLIANAPRSRSMIRLSPRPGVDASGDASDEADMCPVPRNLMSFPLGRLNQRGCRGNAFHDRFLHRHRGAIDRNADRARLLGFRRPRSAVAPLAPDV